MQPVEWMAEPVTDHGGNLAAARRRFPDAVQPWIDLSTGISPFPYPYSRPPATAFERLPEPEDEMRLRAIAAKAYGAPSTDSIVAAPGTQILLPYAFALRKPGRAAVLGPTYAEHERVAALCGHACHTTESIDDLATADLAVAVNPNNPDGRVVGRDALLALAEKLDTRDGLLVVDEAFMDVGPEGESLCGDIDDLPIVVLRSFGKFHGLAGVRLGFAIASQATAALLRDRLGPWAVSGPALATGIEALADETWRQAHRARLKGEAERLHNVLARAGCEFVGGTDLFLLVRHAEADTLRDLLGRNGILVRAFAGRPGLLRFGLPGNSDAWSRLETALALSTSSRQG